MAGAKKAPFLSSSFVAWRRLCVIAANATRSVRAAASGSAEGATDGAIYVVAKLPRADDEAVVEWLAREYGVAVIPGSAFGLNDSCHLRLAYGVLDLETCEEALTRLERGLQDLVV